MATTHTPNYYFVVACGAAKAPHTAAARNLYTSPTFRHFLAAAEAEAEATRRELGANATVLILSAAHGLITPDTIVAPYDVRMDHDGAVDVDTINATAADLGIEYGDEVYSFLPAAYRAPLAEALATDDVLVHDVYEAPAGRQGGIGFQRGVASSLIRTAA
jgi:hypothetical protein